MRTLYEARGDEIRALAKSLVLDFMQATEICQPLQEGISLSQIAKRCGLRWGDYPKATESNQNYWIVAILQELKAEGRVEQIKESGPWRLKQNLSQ